jgi:hypothetical protein
LKTLAHSFDESLKRCGFTTYLPIGQLAGSELWPFSTISPLGPAIFNYTLNIDPEQKYFHEAFMNNLHTTDVILLKDMRPAKELSTDVEEVIKNDFTLTAPSCALPLPELQGSRLYFRK